MKPEDVNVDILEKLVVNWSLLPDFISHTYKAYVNSDDSQTMRERIGAMWSGKIRKYQRLLLMRNNRGRIHQMGRNTCNKTGCGMVRLYLTFMRYLT